MRGVFAYEAPAVAMGVGTAGDQEVLLNAETFVEGLVACQRTGAAVVRFADSEGTERRGSAPWQCRCKARAMTRSDPEWG